MSEDRNASTRLVSPLLDSTVECTASTNFSPPSDSSSSLNSTLLPPGQFFPTTDSPRASSPLAARPTAPTVTPLTSRVSVVPLPVTEKLTSRQLPTSRGNFPSTAALTQAAGATTAADRLPVAGGLTALAASTSTPKTGVPPASFGLLVPGGHDSFIISTPVASSSTALARLPENKSSALLTASTSAASAATASNLLPAPGDLVLLGTPKSAISSSKRSATSPANSAERANKQTRHSETLSSSDASTLSTPPFGSQNNAHIMFSTDAAGPPEWFTSFLGEYRRDRNTANEKLEAEFQKLNTRMDHVDAHILALSQRLDKHGEEILELRQQLNLVTAKQQKSQAVAPPIPDFHNVDTFEAKVLGIPNDVATTSDYQTIVTYLFNALQLTALVYQVALLRPWNSHSRRASNSTSSENTLHALVIQFYSASARDLFLKKSLQLKNLDASQIFQGLTTSKSPIHISAIWPKPLYQRLSKARYIARERGYPPPLVRDLHVFMRESRISEPFAILSDSHLESLPVLLAAGGSQRPATRQTA